MGTPRPTAPDTYTSTDICKLSGLTYRQLDYMARQDTLRPEVVDAIGSGYQRVYSQRDLVKAKIAKRVLDLNLHHDEARVLLQMVHNKLGHVEDYDWLVAPMGKWQMTTLVRNENLWEHVTDHPQYTGWFLLNLKGL